MSVLEIRDLHVTVETDAGHHARSSTASTLTDQHRARPTRSWARTAPASRRSRTRSPATPSTPSTSGSITLDGEDVLAMTVDERARAGLFLAMQYPVEIPGVTVTNFLRTAKTAIDGEAPAIRTWTKDVKRGHEEPAHGPEVRRSATSTRASPAARRSATRSSSSSCSSRRSPCSTRPTPVSTSTRSRSSRRASTAPRTSTGPRRAAHHALHPHPALHPARLRARDGRGRIAEEGGPELADRLEDEGYDRYLEPPSRRGRRRAAEA